MRSFVLAVAVFISACTGGGSMVRSVPADAPRTVFIEPVPFDNYGIGQRLEMIAIQRGYQPVEDAGKAAFRLRAAVDMSASMKASVRLVDASGAVVYVGEGGNPGFGTALSPASSVLGCIDRAASGLK